MRSGWTKSALLPGDGSISTRCIDSKGNRYESEKIVKNWKVVTRLAVLAGILCTLLIGIGTFGLWGMQRAEGGMKSIYDDHMQPALVLGGIGDRLLSARLSLTIAVHTREVTTQNAQISSIEANLADVDKTWKAYTQRRGDLEEARLIKAFSDAKQKFISAGLRATLEEIQKNNAENARRLLVESAGPLFLPVRQSNQALQKYHIQEAQKTFIEAQERNARLRQYFLSAIVGGVFFAIIFGTWVVQSLSRQLGAEPSEAAEFARRVASGDLSVPIVLKMNDSTSLMAQLRSMQDSLASVVKGVRQGAETVATASEEIALGNLDLSQRTEEQASALEQTSASMEELGVIVHNNSDNAHHANELAVTASQVATAGGEVVGKVVQTMNGINDSSKQIANIIGVIDGLAFQTNILALNAAVEAARAGEQGRGFAVVASEVRNLAQRSAQAAKEIKELISNSVQRVDQGMELVGHAGSAMQEIVDVIADLSSIVNEISAAGAEQSLGVAQISKAVTQMDEVTQQNAALVEESAAAAEQLKVQAQGLVQAVAVFKL